MGLIDTGDLMSALGGSGKNEAKGGFGGGVDVPIELTDLDMWANYTNDDLYEMDSKIREFLKKTRYKRQKKDGYRTTASVVFAWMYGREPEPADGYLFRMVHKLLEYYCTSYTGRTTFMGKPVSRVYYFSKFSGSGKRPYSLRLRLEEAEDGNQAVFRNGPDQNSDKRSHGRRKDRGDGR